MATVRELEAIIDAADIGVVEAAMPKGGRPRQLPVRTLLLGVLLTLADHRPCHLTRVHQALLGLPESDKERLHITHDMGQGVHALTYRQVERTFSTLIATMDPTPVPSLGALDEPQRRRRLGQVRKGIDADARENRLVAFCDALAEASIPEDNKMISSSVAVDWTDHASWSRPSGPDTVAVDADATWGHRRPNTPGTKHEAFFGYYGQAITMVPDERKTPVPELIRRVVLHPCNVDPPSALVATIRDMADKGILIGDVLADSGYSHRLAERWATPLRRLGARLVQDLHPHDRGMRGTHQGAICCNGNLYCPATPMPLLELGPLAPSARPTERAAHDRRSAELARYKLGPLSTDDSEGYYRVGCPAALGKLRCPLKASSMNLGFDRPEVMGPPTALPLCCAQASITVAPSVNAKTRQKHDYPSAAHRASYARRTAVERSFSTLKDPATTDVRRGWCRLFGRTKNLVMLVCAVVIRNLRVLASFEKRVANNALGPRRKRRKPESLG